MSNVVEGSPFGGSTGWGRARILGLVVFGLVLAAAAIGIYFATRAQAPDTAAGGHNHGAAHAWHNASIALADAATVAIRRKLMQRVWMNTAWTLEGRPLR